MKLFVAPAWLRAFLLLAAGLIWLGIWDTGLSAASWILYLPAVMFLFAAITGICPSIILTRAVLGTKRG